MFGVWINGISRRHGVILGIIVPPYLLIPLRTLALRTDPEICLRLNNAPHMQRTLSI